MAIDVGEAIGEVLAIDWRDRDGVIKNDVDEYGS
ncbi:hypothetical protein Goarm_012919, partial [Gossypium armourianum]|nr:hypothetical protein [Gossypium armourianum]